jgi:EAL domain-containing protein (putative c-di-GMP-specific phosphodiesterase class I)
MLDTGRVTGAEAQVHWRHPERGLLGPDFIIPLAEQMGLLVDLGHWVLWEACRQAKAWLDAGAPPVRMCVNLAVSQFRAPLALKSDVIAALMQTALPPELLELELTESVLLHASQAEGEVLVNLADLGVTIGIDEFGAGHSSLASLRRARVGRIKIAGILIRHVESLPDDAAVVRATIGMARELGVTVLADGVETKEQAKLLAHWGCAQGQGSHFAPALSPDDFSRLVSVQ